MKTLIIISGFLLSTITGNSQSICASSFKTNNGNGTCGSAGELRLSFPGGCPTDIPIIDSVYTNGVKSNATFAVPDLSKCGGNNGYISYCVTSGNMPPAHVWTIYFHDQNAGAVYNCVILNSTTVILPVKFVYFDATASGNAITCKWISEEEINNNYYELERSFDGTNFITIAMVFGEGTEKTVRNTYQYADKSTSLQAKNIIYYRVKQVDHGGKYSYSNIVTVKRGANDSKGIQASPNPFVDNLALKFEATEKGTAQIRILSFTGQAVTTTNTMVQKGINNLQLGNLTGLAKGIYVAQVLVDGVIVGNQKVVKN